MRSILLMMIISLFITTAGKSQQWQSVVSMDSRFGYSTNSYLNPFLAEWNPAAESGYNVTSAVIQSYWNNNDNSLSLTGGLFFEPLFSRNEYWKGALGVANYNYRFSSNLSAGVESGVSYFSSSYSRTIIWVQPKITWFVSPFTLFRLKAGSNFRKYQNYTNSQSDNNRFDLYGLEFETWPNYRWQLTAGLYGSLDSLPSIQTGFNARSTVSYYFNNGVRIGLNIGLEQYQTETTEQGGGGPPIGGPTNLSSTTVENTDRILRFGIDGSLPINERFSVFTSAEVLRFNSETSGVTSNDYRISGGLRFSFEPRTGKDGRMITPQWQVTGKKQQVSIQYPSEGRLYLVGEFNNWNKTGIPLRKQSDNTYVAQLELSPGAYEYKVLLKRGDSEEWIEFSNETYTVDDGYGSDNAILLVQ